MKFKSRLALIWQGTIGGVIASLCCALPAVVIAAGLSGGIAASLVGLGKFRLYTILAGLIFIGIASWVSLRRSRDCCSPEEYKQRLVVVPITMLVAFAAVYAIITYLVVPVLYRMPG